MRLPRFFCRSAIFTLPLFLAGCGLLRIPYDPTSPTPTPVQPPVPTSGLSFAYVESALAGSAIGGSGIVSMFTVSSSGLWTPTSPTTVSAGADPESLVVDPSGRFVYVANARDNTVSQYVVNLTSGILTPNIPATVPTGSFPQDVAVDPTGRFLYTANSNDNTLSMFTINQTTGALTPNTPAIIIATQSSGSDQSLDPVGLIVDPLGRFLYSCNAGSISGFTLDPATGLLSPVNPFTVTTGTGHSCGMAIDPEGHVLYAPEEGGRLLLYYIDSTSGALTQASPAFVPTGDGSDSVAIDPFGHFLYVVNRNAQTLSQFNVAADGSLTPMSPAIISDPGQPWQILIDPSGQLVYVSNEGTDAVDIYRIGATGQLTHYSSANAGPGAGGMGIARKR